MNLAPPAIINLDDRIFASLAAAVAAEEAAGRPAGVAPFLDFADLVASGHALNGHGQLKEKEIRSRMGKVASDDASVVPLLTLPLAFVQYSDRPALRRNAYHLAQAVGGNEEVGMAAIAAAFLAADALRFDFETVLRRVHQSLLEDAPLSLLRRLAPLEPAAAFGSDRDDPLAVLQLAITGIDRCPTTPAVIEELVMYGEEAGASVVFAAALAGVQRGREGAEADWWESIPKRGRVATLASKLADLSKQGSEKSNGHK